MKQFYLLYEMVRADFLERVRRYSFLLTVGAALYLAYSVSAEKVWLVVGDGYRGVYNSAWIGALMAVCCSVFFSLAGFYVVKNSIQRDTETRVGSVLAATPMRKSFYTLAKTISNFAVLAAMVFVVMLAAFAMRWLHGEVKQISLWKLWSPFLFASLPAMAVTAALAVLFEALPLLRGGVGNVLYFFAWTAGLGLSVNGVNDPTGLQIFYRSMHDTLKQTVPGTKEGFSLTIGGARAVHTFYWPGVDWTAQILLARFFWIVIAVGIALVAAAFFHRFDPAYEWSFRKKAAQAAGVGNGSSGTVNPIVTTPASVHLTPLNRRAKPAWPLPQLIASELRLMLKGQPWWWYVVAAGLVIAQLFSPTLDARRGVLVFAWLWPVLVWSRTGCREERNGTQRLIFSSERALLRQLPAVWVAGVMVALITAGGFGVRALLAADWRSIESWLAGAIFIPSLALALGVWSGTSKLFEALYTVWWYIGPANRTPGFDFIGVTSASSDPLFYFLAAAILLTAAYLGRRARMAYV
ncbi:MAG TPA: hypothetical protein VLW84_03715 [Terriglobales bacterium]|nr:hypothetical protein [Terriglobales bacterium]